MARPTSTSPTPAGVLLLSAYKPEREIESNTSAALIDIGDGVALLEFRSKASVLDEGVVKLMSRAPELLREKGFEALVIGSQDDHFCRGANLLQIGMAAMQKKWDELDVAVNTLQQTFMNLRHGDMPVVVAPYGQTLGGGCEVSLHADHIQANADLFMGLVEIGGRGAPGRRWAQGDRPAGLGPRRADQARRGVRLGAPRVREPRPPARSRCPRSRPARRAGSRPPTGSASTRAASSPTPSEPRSAWSRPATTSRPIATSSST